MVNRNAGSGTRILIDQWLGDRRPAGYGTQTKSHNAVAVAVSQQRADWGIAIDTVARQYGLGFIPVQEEQYDFVVPTARLERPALRAFRELLDDPGIRGERQPTGYDVQQLTALWRCTDGRSAPGMTGGRDSGEVGDGKRAVERPPVCFNSV